MFVFVGFFSVWRVVCFFIFLRGGMKKMQVRIDITVLLDMTVVRLYKNQCRIK